MPDGKEHDAGGGTAGGGSQHLRRNEQLQAYAASVQQSKGVLALFLVVTDRARERGLPLEAASLVVDGGGQVKRLGRPAVQRILARHGVTEVLAREGGRTSMGSVHKMRRYVDLLNRLHEEGLADPDAIEAFWIARVREFLARRQAAPVVPRPRRPSPLRLTLDADRSLRSVFRELFRQAEDRDLIGRSRAHVGALLNHLVAAALDWEPPTIAERPDRLVTDAWSSRPGSFERGDAELFVTAGPSEAAMADCRQALDRGRHPILITLATGTAVATHLAETAGIREQVEVFDIEQFLILDLYLRCRFRTAKLRPALRRLISRYNQIVEAGETDPSLRIRFRRTA